MLNMPMEMPAFLFLCSIKEYANEHVQPMQQQGQPQGQAHAYRHHRLSLPLSRRL